MAIINTETKLTKELQQDIVELANKSYDKGGADVLKLIFDTLNGITNPIYINQVVFTRNFVEAIRKQLAEVVQEETHDELPKENLVVIP